MIFGTLEFRLESETYPPAVADSSLLRPGSSAHITVPVTPGELVGDADGDITPMAHPVGASQVVLDGSVVAGGGGDAADEALLIPRGSDEDTPSMASAEIDSGALASACRLVFDSHKEDDSR